MFLFFFIIITNARTLVCVYQPATSPELVGGVHFWTYSTKSCSGITKFPTFVKNRKHKKIKVKKRYEGGVGEGGGGIMERKKVRRSFAVYIFRPPLFEFSQLNFWRRRISICCIMKEGSQGGSTFLFFAHLSDCSRKFSIVGIFFFSFLSTDSATRLT